MVQQAIDSGPGRGARPDFYVVVAALTALIIFLGFAPSYYLKPFIQAPPPLTPLSMTHGLVYTAWMVLFVIQACLVPARRIALHRQLGMVGAMLFGAMMVLGVSTAITAGRLGHAPPGSPPPLVFMALPLLGIPALIAVVGLALMMRRRRDWHQRLMTAGFIMIAQPAIGRFFIPAGVPQWQMHGSFVVIELMLLGVTLWDSRREGRVHPAWLVALGATGLFHLAVTWAFAGAGWWTALAAWLTRAT
ncbi:hypothetical protein [Phenylobacterium kunshanense]|uniref:DUF2306 domain-containing protein n=1 Tax=Phenylobacterium kunshanense TaxID=1445034 RepID=A0A328BR84_9CAUL|nr:hypothetical protein [Phenylobacterium kunshanense]RAK69051.1 hypothetical protein DJ019_03315 [Phenylobacterium kunshanense]